jgi:hypothetical protein
MLQQYRADFLNNPAVQAQIFTKMCLIDITTIFCLAACFQIHFYEFLAMGAGNMSDGSSSPFYGFGPLLLRILRSWPSLNSFFTLKSPLSGILMDLQILAMC